MGETVYVQYKGMRCKLFKCYLSKDDGPLVMITSSADLKKAYDMGFHSIGYPDEVAKKISEEEYNILSRSGRLD